MNEYALKALSQIEYDSRQGFIHDLLSVEAFCWR